MQIPGANSGWKYSGYLRDRTRETVFLSIEETSPKVSTAGLNGALQTTGVMVLIPITPTDLHLVM